MLELIRSERTSLKLDHSCSPMAGLQFIMILSQAGRQMFYRPPLREERLTKGSQERTVFRWVGHPSFCIESNVVRQHINPIAHSTKGT